MHKFIDSHAKSGAKQVNSILEHCKSNKRQQTISNIIDWLIGQEKKSSFIVLVPTKSNAGYFVVSVLNKKKNNQMHSII